MSSPRKRRSTRNAKNISHISISDSEEDDYKPPPAKKKTKANGDGKKVPARTALPKSVAKPRHTASKLTVPLSSEAAVMLSQMEQISTTVASDIIRLLDDANTIPFLCRYRKEMIGLMSPERLRQVRDTYAAIKKLKARSECVMQTLEKADVLTPSLKQTIQGIKCLEELEHFYSLYKPERKGTLAERASSLGLQQIAEKLLSGFGPPLCPSQAIRSDTDGLKTEADVCNGIKDIIVGILAKNVEIVDELRRLQIFHDIKLTSSEVKVKEKPANESQNYELYFNFTQIVERIQPHQVLAINRAENLKFVTVKLNFPDTFRSDLKRFVDQKYLSCGRQYAERTRIVNLAFEEAFKKRFRPFLTRKIRAELTKRANHAGIEVFATNLKQLLLVSPVKGARIIGIDPGFTHGCKYAVISEQGDVLDTGVFYVHKSRYDWTQIGNKLAHIMDKHKCTLIALGNGTACRQTEEWITHLFNNQILSSDRIKYTIVSEQGASMYSCSPIARKEFPDYDVNVISACSIARRLHDPLSELVKIQPQHLGVGMYQHDLDQKQLAHTLDEVVSECVSFVGVNLNTASASLLSYIAGIGPSKADKIITHRTNNGAFSTRQQLRNVPTIGSKTFEQCAGFLRIDPSIGHDFNLLDSTWVHPESYELAYRIIKIAQLSVKEIGTPAFIRKMSSQQADRLAVELEESVETVKLVLDSLQRELMPDYRAEIDAKPFFKQGISKMSDLKTGTILTGAVMNITHFGCFVDCGVEKSGLVHISQLRGVTLKIADKIECRVGTVDVARGRIPLEFIRLL